MDPTWADGAEELAQAIWERSAEPHIKGSPHQVASLTMDVIRTERAMTDLLNLELIRVGAGVASGDPPHSAEFAAEQEARAALNILAALARLQWYQDRAEARIRRIFAPPLR